LAPYLFDDSNFPTGIRCLNNEKAFFKKGQSGDWRSREQPTHHKNQEGIELSFAPIEIKLSTTGFGHG